jgi:hypothetical protein
MRRTADHGSCRGTRWISRLAHQRTSRYDRGRRWCAVWTGLNGKRYSKAWDRRTDAERHADFMVTEAKENAALWLELAEAESAHHDSSR